MGGRGLFTGKKNTVTRSTERNGAKITGCGREREKCGEKGQKVPCTLCLGNPQLINHVITAKEHTVTVFAGVTSLFPPLRGLLLHFSPSLTC